MTEFIVLGQIPGTSIQLDFMLWLYISFGVFLLGIFSLIWRHRHAIRRTLASYAFVLILFRYAIAPRRLA